MLRSIRSVLEKVYSIKQDELVWAAQSQTANPSKVGPFIHALVTKAAGPDEEGRPRPLSGGAAVGPGSSGPACARRSPTWRARA